MGNGNTDVGSKTPTRQSGQPIIERLASSGLPDLRIDNQAGLKREGAGKCGAMSEQSADSGRGNEQVPQKLVHLVGYRDPNAGRTHGFAQADPGHALTHSLLDEIATLLNGRIGCAPWHDRHRGG